MLVSAGSGDVTVHVQPVYGHSGRPAANAAFFGRVLEYAARHGNAPQLLGGDFNDPLDDLRRLPQSLSMALLTRRLVDVDAELAAATGGERVCCYEGGAGMRPTRIDGLLTSTALAPMMRLATALPETGIPGHMPAVFELGLEAADQRVARFVKPKKEEVPQRDPEALEELGECLLSPLEAEWTTMLERGDVDAARKYWTWTAEEVLLALSLPHLAPADIDGPAPLPVAPATLSKGRGTGTLVRETRLCPRQQKQGGAPETLPLARVHAAQGALRTVLRWLRRPDPRPGAAPRGLPCAWEAARSRLRRVREMGPAFAALPPLEEHVSLPGEGPLQGAMEALKGMAKAQRAREDRERVRAWREWLDKAWSADQGAVYRWLGGEGFTPPVVFLTREDGTPTSDVAEMDALVRRDWAPINQKYEHAPEPCPEAFLRAYGRHIRRVPMHLQPLTGEKLCRRLRRMKPSALGLDGWSLGDLRALPRGLHWLAALLRLVEDQGCWPARLAEGYTALVPKDGPPGALNTHPLTVLSTIYRLWAGLRLEEVILWQESWAHPLAFGFRPGRGSLDGAAVTQLLLDGQSRGWASITRNVSISSLGAPLNPKLVPAKLFHCSRLYGRNKKSSKFVYPPTKPTRT